MQYLKTVSRAMAGAVITLMAFSAPKSHALSEFGLGERCWRLDPFVDTLRIDVSQADDMSVGTFQLLFGRWRAGGSYQVQVTGHLSQSSVDPASLAFGIIGTGQWDPTSNDVIALYARLNPVTLSGPWTLVWLQASPPFRNSGTLTPVPCDPSMEPIAGPNALGR